MEQKPDGKQVHPISREEWTKQEGKSNTTYKKHPQLLCKILRFLSSGAFPSYYGLAGYTGTWSPIV